MLRIILSSLLIAATHASAQVSAAGAIVGTIIDSRGGSIPNAQITLLRPGAIESVARTTASPSGTFTIPAPNPGTYTVKIQVRGWRTRRTDHVQVLDGGTTDLGNIKLEMAGCDAPRAICDDVFSDPQDAPPTPLASDYLTLSPGCEADLSHSKSYCESAPPPQPNSTDFLISRSGGSLYLIPLYGTKITAPDSADALCEFPAYTTDPIRLDGLGPGDDFCVRTHDDHFSHVFFVDDIDQASTKITIWHVTTKPALMR